MKYGYVYDPVALAEYKEALSWYKERSETAAFDFIAEIKERIGIICSDPFRYRNTYKQFREVSLKKFPYCIVYFPDDNSNLIVIVSVFHHKRNPMKKYRKKG